MYMLKLNASPMEERLKGFWNLLSLFWREGNGRSPRADTCCNLIHLNHEVHRLWIKDLFAFKPIKSFEDPNELMIASSSFSRQNTTTRKIVVSIF